MEFYGKHGRLRNRACSPALDSTSLHFACTVLEMKPDQFSSNIMLAQDLKTKR